MGEAEPSFFSESAPITRPPGSCQERRSTSRFRMKSKPTGCDSCTNIHLFINSRKRRRGRKGDQVHEGLALLLDGEIDERRGAAGVGRRPWRRCVQVTKKVCELPIELQPESPVRARKLHSHEGKWGTGAAAWLRTWHSARSPTQPRSTALSTMAYVHAHTQCLSYVGFEARQSLLRLSTYAVLQRTAHRKSLRVVGISWLAASRALLAFPQMPPT